MLPNYETTTRLRAASDDFEVIINVGFNDIIVVLLHGKMKNDGKRANNEKVLDLMHLCCPPK